MWHLFFAPPTDRGQSVVYIVYIGVDNGYEPNIWDRMF